MLNAIQPPQLTNHKLISTLGSRQNGNSSVTGEFPTQKPVTRSFDVFFDLPLNKRLSKQSWGWWFETPSDSLWHHYNDQILYRNCHMVGYRFIRKISTTIVCFWTYKPFIKWVSWCTECHPKSYNLKPTLANISLPHPRSPLFIAPWERVFIFLIPMITGVAV